MKIESLIVGVFVSIAYYLGLVNGAKNEKHFTDMANKRLNDCHAVILGEKP